MVKHLKKCEACSRYGLSNPNEICRKCGGTLLNVYPPKFSLVDKYAKYRLAYFKEEFNKKFK